MEFDKDVIFSTFIIRKNLLLLFTFTIIFFVEKIVDFCT